MILFFLLLLSVFTLSGAIVIWMEIGITNDRVIWLQERLTKLEKDAVKVTFSEPPLFHPKPKTQTDYAREHSKEFESEVKNVIITTLKEKHKKRKPKTTKEWEDEFDLGGHE